MMDLRALRYFIQVADSRSFSKAAVLLRIGQPALSRSVMQLEHELSVKLFRRTHTGVELTQSGRLLRQRAKGLLDQVGRIPHEIRAEADEIVGTCTLGVPASIGQLIVPALLSHLTLRQPGIRLHTVEGISSETYDRLLTQTVHVGLIYDPLPHRDLVLRPIAIEDMYLVGRADMLATLGKSCHLQDLENLPMILPTAPNSRRLLVEKAFIERNLVLNVAAEVDSFVVTRALVSAGLGCSLTTLSSIADLRRSSPLSYLTVGPDRISWVLNIAHHAASCSNQIVQAVVSALESVAIELMSSNRWKGSRTYLPEPV